MHSRLLVTQLFSCFHVIMALTRRELHSGHSQHQSLVYSVQEEQPPGTFVGNVFQDSGLMKLINGREGHSTIKIFMKQRSEYFTLEEKEGVLYTRETIDREKLCLYELSCRQTVEVIVQHGSYHHLLTVNINILDINDHAPTFPSESFTLEVVENIPTGTIFAIPAAEDMDSEPLSVHNYQLIAESDTFELKISHQVDGSHDVRLMLKGKLDREKIPLYLMTVVATDGGNPPKSSSIQLNVRVKDANDNSPQFNSSVHEAKVYENVPVGTSILRVEAVDLDEGLNGVVHYKIAELESVLDEIIPFNINDTTGEVYVSGSVDYESRSEYRLTVVASDSGMHSFPTFATIILHVLDLNDNAPRISVNIMTSFRHAQVSEDAPVDTFVCHITVTDADSGVNGQVDCGTNSRDFHLETLTPTTPQKSYSHSLVPFLSGNTPHSRTSSAEYKLVTSRSFDREFEPRLTVTIQCRDQGFPDLVSSKTFHIDVTDVNDNSPKFDNDIFFTKTEEDVFPGTVLRVLNATDADVGRNGALVYSMAPVDGTPQGAFEIDRATGAVSAATVLDYESRQVYSYLVRVSDQGEEPLSASASLVINIEDVNDERPRFERKEYRFTARENEPLGSHVGLVRAVDSDASQNFHKVFYFLTDVEEDIKPDDVAKYRRMSRMFSINQQTGEIRNSAILDREETWIWKFTVLASNFDNLTVDTDLIDRARVTVYVGDVNDNRPMVTHPSYPNETIYIWKSIPAGTVVTRVQAVDEDEALNAILNFALVKTSREYLPFRVDRYSGDVITTEAINMDDVQKDFYLSIEVKDGGFPPHSDLAWIHISINSSADPHKFARFHYGADTDELISSRNSSDLTLALVGSVCGGVLIVMIVVISIVFHRLRVKPRAAEKNSRKRLASGETVDGSYCAVNNHTDSPLAKSDGSDTTHHFRAGDFINKNGYPQGVKSEAQSYDTAKGFVNRSAIVSESPSSCSSQRLDDATSRLSYCSPVHGESRNCHQSEASRNSSPSRGITTSMKMDRSLHGVDYTVQQTNHNPDNILCPHSTSNGRHDTHPGYPNKIYPKVIMNSNPQPMFRSPRNAGHGKDDPASGSPVLVKPNRVMDISCLAATVPGPSSKYDRENLTLVNTYVVLQQKQRELQQNKEQLLLLKMRRQQQQQQQQQCRAAGHVNPLDSLDGSTRLLYSGREERAPGSANSQVYDTVVSWSDMNVPV